MLNFLFQNNHAKMVKYSNFLIIHIFQDPKSWTDFSDFRKSIYAYFFKAF
jgi:hypothetical protein